MKIRLVLTLAAAAIGLSAQAQTPLPTKTALVQATILDTCKFDRPAETITLGLGALDPSSGTTFKQSRALTFACTKGYRVNVGIAGQPVLQPAGRILTHTSDARESIPYQLLLATPDGTTGKGFGAGNELSIALDAEITAGHYANARGGVYEDTVVIELQP